MTVEVLYGIQIYAERLGSEWGRELDTVLSIANRYSSFKGYSFHINAGETEPRPVLLFTDRSHAEKCVKVSNFLLKHEKPALEMLKEIGYGRAKKERHEEKLENQRRS